MLINLWHQKKLHCCKNIQSNYSCKTLYAGKCLRIVCKKVTLTNSIRNHQTNSSQCSASVYRWIMYNMISCICPLAKTYVLWDILHHHYHQDTRVTDTDTFNWHFVLFSNLKSGKSLIHLKLLSDLRSGERYNLICSSKF